MWQEEQIYEWLESVTDPEIPNVSIRDMGILQSVHIIDEQSVQVVITPTYSGCPAMDMISMQVRMVLMGHGVKNVDVVLKLSPAWTTDWITAEGKQKMLAYGIAPPKRRASEALGLFEEDRVPCPKCNSEHTELVSRFGATSCKALYRCLDCKEPFEHFKCH
jgi:ring-1,2-phenylacetyl-CoA epoxidase subunit PaaD